MSIARDLARELAEIAAHPLADEHVRYCLESAALFVQWRIDPLHWWWLQAILDGGAMLMIERRERESFLLARAAARVRGAVYALEREQRALPCVLRTREAA